MKSLEFIKRHVTEWPASAHGGMVTHVLLFSNGRVGFGSDDGESVDVYYGYDLSEHFAPDYYDGKVYTREEFESFGVEKSVTSSAPAEGIDATVEERGNRYGAFKDGADIIQELKSVMRSTPNWNKLTPSQREALEMIQHKVGRILNGDPNYTDSWHDIKGYAHLIEEELNVNVK